MSEQKDELAERVTRYLSMFRYNANQPIELVGVLWAEVRRLRAEHEADMNRIERAAQCIEKLNEENNRLAIKIAKAKGEIINCKASATSDPLLKVWMHHERCPECGAREYQTCKSSSGQCAIDAQFSPLGDGPWSFDRYVDGKLKAEGVVVSRAENFEQACIQAMRLAPAPCVLVLRRDAQSPEAGCGACDKPDENCSRQYGICDRYASTTQPEVRELRELLSRSEFLRDTGGHDPEHSRRVRAALSSVPQC